MVDIEKIKQTMPEFAKKHNLSLVLLFGSQASGKTHKKSDTDIAFLSEKKIGLSEIAKITFELSEKIGVKDIEMVLLNGAHPLLLKQAAQKSILLYEKEQSLFAQFKIYAAKRFIEARKLFTMREASFDKFLKKYDRQRFN
jgi:uncharacterized protein